MKNLIARPALYAIWAPIVAVALYATYFSDPHVFGFTTLGLAWLTVGVGLVGAATCVFSRSLRARDRVIIVVALVLAAVAVIKALAVLRTFKWA